MKNNLNFLNAFLLMLILATVGCKKEEIEENETQSQAVAENESDDMLFKDEELLTGNCDYNWSELLAPCATVTESQEDFPKVVTIDYGTGCTNANGVTKSGKIIIEASAPLSTVGASRHVTFENFMVNNVSIAGSRHLENTGINDGGNALIDINASLTFTRDGISRTRTANHVREWVGYETCTKTDDAFYVTGSGSVSRNGGPARPYVITEAIHFQYGCNYPMAGVIDIGASENRGAIIDFGNDICDEFAEVTIKRNGEVRIFNMQTRSFE